MALNAKQRNSALIISSLEDSQQGSWGHSKNCGSISGCPGNGGWLAFGLQAPNWPTSYQPDRSPRSTPPDAHVSDKTVYNHWNLGWNSILCLHREARCVLHG